MHPGDRGPHVTAEGRAEPGAVWPGPWRVESLEGGSGARRGVGDSGAEGGAAPGRVWEALAVMARGRDIPEPLPCSPHGAELSGSAGSMLRGRVCSRLNEPLYPLWAHFKCLE